MKKVLGTLGILLLFAMLGGSDVSQLSPVLYPVEDFSEDTAYSVVRVIDGDTVEIDHEGITTDVRLIGVDTPETVHPSKPVELYGKEASAFLNNLLLGESVYLRFDSDKTDKYGRMLAYLYRAPDGLFVNLEIVRQGYGHAYTQFPFKHSEMFLHYASKAKAAGRGLHGVQASSTSASESQDKASAAVKSESAEQVYVTRTGKKYHRDGCSSLRKSKKPISLADAKQRYSPCGRCNPPR